ncbi:hypothetical protein DAPPUDRAFT_233726 [Daphnia pulex]|uniref:Uncharacterized protein n=1 Tax=Daphnia pulex TaxID=6669 RepID=E9FVJ9_DAPPU|nr:hypothetical protein DAPPUDRAFT_233726 [Daphnia pulex]|eukprot:EFX88568.1 hypothetical protein DAPPUDRAFT_233726 [Daphnia pulex]
MALNCSLVVSFALMRFPRRRDPRDFDPFAREEDSFDSPSPRDPPSPTTEKEKTTTSKSSCESSPADAVVSLSPTGTSSSVRQVYNNREDDAIAQGRQKSNTDRSS